TFVLPDGTKISVGTEQYQNTEHRVSSTLTITRGDQAVTVTGVNSESPTISNVMSNGHELDAQTNDGYIFTTVKGSADDWALDNKEVDAGSTSTEEQVALDANYRNELQVIDKEELSKLGIDVVDADSDGTLSVDDLSA